MSNKGRINFLTIQVRLGVITIDDVPEEYREAVRKNIEN